MKKVYTVTFQRVLNYGAVLQAYALMRFLQENGYDVEVLDYAPNYFLWQTLRPAKGITKTIQKFSKYKKFKAFRDKYMNLTPKTYYSQDSLKSLPKAHAAVCGSDQIWNCNLTSSRFDSTFFLDFAPESTKRIAFAASAGSIRLNQYSEEVQGFLDKFDYLGAREAILALDIKEVSPSTNPVVVVDPCLLIKDYSNVFDATRIPDGKYIVSYVVGSGEMLDLFNEKIKELKSITDIPIIHLGAKEISAADHNILDIGPSEWVTFINKSAFVITNSFHGTAFSINFEKSFYFIPHVIENLNSRQTTLLESVGLLGQMVPDGTKISSLPVVDYDVVNLKLNEVVDFSKSYLLNSLSSN